MLNDARLEELRGWIRERQAPHCVSLYMSLDTKGPAARRDSIRLRGMLEDAERQLAARGASADEIDTLLAPARAFIEAPGAWRSGQPGLALFLWGDEVRRYDLRRPVPDVLHVGNAPYIKPLLRDRVPDDRFYVLTLSRTDAALWAGDTEGLTRIESDAIPRSVEDALGEEQMQPTLQSHTLGGGGGVGRAPSIFHGHGGARDEAEHQLQRFLHMVDRGVLAVVTDRSRPLVLVGVPRNVGAFREVSRYPALVTSWVAGDPADIERREGVHAAVWPIVLPHLRARELEARRRFRILQSTPRVSTDLEEVLCAAQEGRIETLFAAADGVRLGHFDPQARRIRLGASTDAVDLVELAVERALAQNADVFTSSAPSVPGGGVVAATYRY
jgi:hypothetical protein